MGLLPPLALLPAPPRGSTAGEECPSSLSSRSRAAVREKTSATTGLPAKISSRHRATRTAHHTQPAATVTNVATAAEADTKNRRAGAPNQAPPKRQVSPLPSPTPSPRPPAISCPPSSRVSAPRGSPPARATAIESITTAASVATPATVSPSNPSPPYALVLRPEEEGSGERPSTRAVSRSSAFPTRCLRRSTLCGSLVPPVVATVGPKLSRDSSGTDAGPAVVDCCCARSPSSSPRASLAWGERDARLGPSSPLRSPLRWPLVSLATLASTGPAWLLPLSAAAARRAWGGGGESLVGVIAKLLHPSYRDQDRPN